MKIGIPFKAHSTAFGSGRAQAILAIAEVCADAGHTVVLLQETEMDWWEDVRSLEKAYTIQRLGTESDLDLLLDIDGLVNPDLRKAKKVVVLFRSDPSFEYLEQAAYMSQTSPYSLQGVHEVWVWDLMVSAERLPLLQTMMEDLPVRQVPYVWTPVLLNQYLANELVEVKPSAYVKPWIAVVSEKNTTVTSSCILPLLGAKKASCVKEILLCNAKDLQTNSFFQENLVQNGINSKDSNLYYEGRLRYADLMEEASCLHISHVRHIPFRPGLLDILWLNLPLVHNCDLLKAYGSYYAEQDVEALTRAIETYSTQPCENRSAIEAAWSVEKGVDRWAQLLAEQPTLHIGFTDMWEGFDPANNFFLELLQSVQTTHVIKGSVGSADCHLLICGPFGTTGLPIEGPPRVYYSGEPPSSHEGLDSRIKLWLTHSPIESDHQMRLPVWALFLDWWGSGTDTYRNPNQLPLHYSLLPFDGPRSEFCAFVVSNPLSQERNQAFEAVNAYKRVNSGGMYKNNIGGPLNALFAGGGAGDQTKFEFFKKHRFAICYENSIAPGYVTEKLLHAKMAGCIPLYRGSLDAAKDFDPAGFVHVEDGQDVVEHIQRLERDSEAAIRMASKAALDTTRLQAMRNQLQAIGKKMIALATQKRPVPSQNQVILPSVSTKPPLFVTFATQSFVGALRSAIHGVEALQKKEPAIRMRVYLGHDASKEALEREFPWVAFRTLPNPPPAFPDQFEPTMFGWKLWLLHDTCHDPDLEGDPILYADAGSLWISVPTDMLSLVEQSGLCLVRDRDQTNRRWCSKEMVDHMGVTDSELEAHQLTAATLGFQAGHPAALRLLDEALFWGSKKEVLFGPYFGGIGSDGKPFGHRHDQSILSILSTRQHSPCLDLGRVVCEASLRKAYQKSTPLYLHRGVMTTHQPVLLGIDDVWVLSLDRRPDRWQTLLQAHPTLQTLANRIPAIDGRLLELMPSIANLFVKNDFQWKKSVLGCALSHVLTWAQLASEHPSVRSYLIMEDDCRFLNSAKWKEQLATVMSTAPANADVLMLGGVLPANLATYPSLLNPVNEHWATILPNDVFSATPIPFCHFCAYSYVLTKTGAKKLMDAIHTRGIYTSIDHYMLHPSQGLTTYVLKDLITTCFQAEDPSYKTAVFDEFLRVDTYDSDIWNNKECFQKIRVSDEPLNLWSAIVDLFHQAPYSIQSRNTLREEAICPVNPSTVYYCPDESIKLDGRTEEPWLKSLWPTIVYKPFPSIASLPPNSWLLVARPVLDFWTSVCQGLEARGCPFQVLHLSDEGVQDSIDFYQFSMCKKVIRNYARLVKDEKVKVLPLGPAVRPAPSLSPLPTFAERPLAWGFHGSLWKGREGLLAPLKRIEPNACKFIPEFGHGSASKPEAYRDLLLKSQCVPCPRGNHVETFRLYEALEYGAIPIYVRSEGDREHWAWLRSHLHLIEISSWDRVPTILELFRKSPEKAEKYRTGLLAEWAVWKAECKTYFP